MPAADQANASQADPPGLTFSVSVSASQHLIIEVLRRPVECTLYGATAQRIESRGTTATAVAYQVDGRDARAEGDLIVLGTNALFNAHILQQSGDTHPTVGKRLNEQVSVSVRLNLAGIDNFQGSTSLTGHGYMFYDGHHRALHAACLVETSNIIPRLLRQERDRWRQLMTMKFIFEDLPSEDNFVAHTDEELSRPATPYCGHSGYTKVAIDRLPEMLDELAGALPMESYSIGPINPTESHIQGTTVMGLDPRTSVLDRHLVHHRLRNLVVLGSGAFPSCPPANPTLTIAALSLWSARQVLR